MNPMFSSRPPQLPSTQGGVCSPLVRFAVHVGPQSAADSASGPGPGLILVHFRPGNPFQAKTGPAWVCTLIAQPNSFAFREETSFYNHLQLFAPPSRLNMLDSLNPVFQNWIRRQVQPSRTILTNMMRYINLTEKASTPTCPYKPYIFDLCSSPMNAVCLIQCIFWKPVVLFAYWNKK